MKWKNKFYLFSPRKILQNDLWNRLGRLLDGPYCPEMSKEAGSRGWGDRGAENTCLIHTHPHRHPACFGSSFAHPSACILKGVFHSSIFSKFQSSDDFKKNKHTCSKIESFLFK
jgi:hypothetical protein